MGIAVFECCIGGGFRSSERFGFVPPLSLSITTTAIGMVVRMHDRRVVEYQLHLPRCEQGCKARPQRLFQPRNKGLCTWVGTFELGQAEKGSGFEGEQPGHKGRVCEEVSAEEAMETPKQQQAVR